MVSGTIALRSARIRYGPLGAAPYVGAMPEISRFFGIIVAMFHRDHNPPHIHAFHGEYHITVEVRTGAVTGSFPPRALGLLLEWIHVHRMELLENWERAQAGQSVRPIAPLE